MNFTPRELLQALCRIPSVFPAEQKISRFIGELLLQHGFVVERVLTDGDRPNLIATSGSGANATLGFYGHLDTVPPASDFTRDPFEVVFDEDTARGLGVCDMKAGLAAIILSGVRAASKGIPVKLVFGVDEEDFSRGAHDLIDSGLLNSIEFLVVAESGQVEDFTQPLSLCFGRKGRIVFDIEVKGRAAHAAESHRGENAIERAAELIGHFRELRLARHHALGATSIVVQEFDAKAASFSVPDLARLSVSALTVPGDSAASLRQGILHLAEDLGIKVTVQERIRPTPYGEAYETPLDHPLTRRFLGLVAEPLGLKPIYTASVADENVFAKRLGIPVVTLGVIGGGDHTKDEWMKVSSLETLIDAYTKLIEGWQLKGV